MANNRNNRRVVDPPSIGRGDEHDVLKRFPVGDYKRDDSQLVRRVLSVDSISRTGGLSSPSNNYTISFPPISQVKKMQLISSEIPNSEYTIDARNNIIDLTANGGDHAIVITPGSYTAVSLADELSRLFHAALGVPFGTVFAITYVAYSQKLRFARIDNGVFSLLWSSGPNTVTSPKEVLGFANDFINVTEAVSESLVNLAGEHYIYLCIRKFKALETTQNIDSVFAKIIFDIPPRFISYNSYISNPIVFETPIQKLSQMEISFRKKDGTLYDFNSSEHSFSIEIFTAERINN